MGHAASDMVDYKQLREGIEGLDRMLLESVSSEPPDPLTFVESVAVRSYLLLAHATLEQYVEQAFVTYADSALCLDANGRVGPGMYLTAVTLAGEIAGQLKADARTPVAVLEKLRHLYAKKVVDPNHGVKRLNLRNLCLGAGIDWVAFENDCASLIAALDTVGARRGSIAHSFDPSPAGIGVTPLLYPQNVREPVEAALNTLPDLDSFLARADSTPINGGRVGRRIGESILAPVRTAVRTQRGRLAEWIHP